MGRIKNKEIKKAAFHLLEMAPEKFTSDFEKNKLVLNEMKVVEEKKMRNKVAGYIARVSKHGQVE